VQLLQARLSVPLPGGLLSPRRVPEGAVVIDWLMHLFGSHVGHVVSWYDADGCVVRGFLCVRCGALVDVEHGR
jgi:hypothetical protein